MRRPSYFPYGLTKNLPVQGLGSWYPDVSRDHPLRGKRAWGLSAIIAHPIRFPVSLADKVVQAPLPPLRAEVVRGLGWIRATQASPPRSTPLPPLRNDARPRGKAFARIS